MLWDADRPEPGGDGAPLRILLSGRDRHLLSPRERRLDTTRPRNPANAGEFGALHAPEQVLVYGGSDPDLDEPASRGKQLWAPETDTICRNDIAFVLLEHELSLPVASVRFGRGVARGEHTLVVGYGANDANTTERHERGGVEVLDVGESDFGPATGLAPPRTFVVGPSACQGDSGGPALSAAGAVLGVSSWGRGDCSSSEARNFYVQLGAFEDLARVVFEASGHDPVLEPEERNPGEGGGAGTAGEAGAIEKSRPALQQEAGCTWSPGPRRGEPTRGHARRVAEGRGSETRGEHASDRQRGVPSVWSWWWLAFGGLALWRRLA